MRKLHSTLLRSGLGILTALALYSQSGCREARFLPEIDQELGQKQIEQQIEKKVEQTVFEGIVEGVLYFPFLLDGRKGPNINIYLKTNDDKRVVIDLYGEEALPYRKLPLGSSLRIEGVAHAPTGYWYPPRGPGSSFADYLFREVRITPVDDS